MNLKTQYDRLRLFTLICVVFIFSLYGLLFISCGHGGGDSGDNDVVIPNIPEDPLNPNFEDEDCDLIEGENNDTFLLANFALFILPGDGPFKICGTAYSGDDNDLDSDFFKFFTSDELSISFEVTTNGPTPRVLVWTAEYLEDGTVIYFLESVFTGIPGHLFVDSWNIYWMDVTKIDGFFLEVQQMDESAYNYELEIWSS